MLIGRICHIKCHVFRRYFLWAILTFHFMLTKNILSDICARQRDNSAGILGMHALTYIGWICLFQDSGFFYCPACRTSLIATRFWVVMICPIIKCLTVLEFSFILFDLCLFITFFNFILNHVPIVTFWILTYHKIWILLIIFCFIWSYWIIYFLTCLEVFWSVVS